MRLTRSLNSYIPESQLNPLFIPNGLLFVIENQTLTSLALDVGTNLGSYLTAETNQSTIVPLIGASDQDSNNPLLEHDERAHICVQYSYKTGDFKLFKNFEFYAEVNLNDMAKSKNTVLRFPERLLNIFDLLPDTLNMIEKPRLFGYIVSIDDISESTDCKSMNEKACTDLPGGKNGCVWLKMAKKCENLPLKCHNIEHKEDCVAMDSLSLAHLRYVSIVNELNCFWDLQQKKCSQGLPIQYQYNQKISADAGDQVKTFSKGTIQSEYQCAAECRSIADPSQNPADERCMAFSYIYSDQDCLLFGAGSMHFASGMAGSKTAAKNLRRMMTSSQGNVADNLFELEFLSGKVLPPQGSADVSQANFKTKSVFVTESAIPVSRNPNSGVSENCYYLYVNLINLVVPAPSYAIVFILSLYYTLK